MSTSSESETHKRIRLAIVRLEKGQPKVVEKGRKVSVAAVAEEAGVSRALIHKDYPDMLERIRGNSNKAIQRQRDEKHEKLKEERFKNRQLREKIVDLTEQRNELASKNATLELENRRLSAILESKNVRVFRGELGE
ncbi:TetR family transcriptional regulator [Marinobacter sp. S6332]|uniref:TetR family transcriptional regulator n=1 Tax=Marinobacter sp. S6332 TaxID=2926403 RepID=UPI001FF6728F|nr:TetR family transcriptional regulator [Marinobacter sp. S6332]MCK0165779.1 TetR family transcriptional regulator [Marinobacter sp. S6332]